MTHTGRLITKCNTNSPTPAPQKCYGQYMKHRVSKYINNRTMSCIKECLIFGLHNILLT